MILQDVQKHESKILNDLSQTQESINNKQALLYEMVSQSQQNQVELNLKNKEVQTLARLTNTAYLMATEFYDIPILFAREIQKQEPPHSSLQALNRSKNPRDSLVSSHGMNDVFNLNESILKSKKYSKALMQSVFMVINNQREWKKFLSKLPNPSIEDQTPQNVYHWIKNIYQIKLIDFEKSLAHQNQLDGDIHSLQSELDLLNNHNKQLTFELNQQQKRKCSPL